MRYIDADKILYTDLSEGRGVCWVTFSDWIKEMPTADVRENVRGKWIKDGMSGLYKFQCSECGCYHRAMYDFCPSCGADMRGEDHGEI